MLGFDTTRNCRQIKHKGLCGVFFLYTTNISTGLSFSSHDFNLLFGGNKYISQEKHTISHVTKAVLYHERSTMPCAWFVFSVCLIFLSFMLFPYCYLLSEYFFQVFLCYLFSSIPFFSLHQAFCFFYGVQSRQFQRRGSTSSSGTSLSTDLESGRLLGDDTE